MCVNKINSDCGICFGMETDFNRKKRDTQVKF